MSQSVRAFKETVEMRRFSLLKLRSHRYAVAVGIGAILLALACAHIWQRVTVIHLSMEVTRLQAEHRELVDQSRKVNSEISSLSMAARIEPFAIDSLGLVMVPADRLFTVRTEKKPNRTQQLDQYAELMSVFKRVSDHFPVLSQTVAEAETTDTIKFDSTGRGEAAE
jgi:cell division protein FtsL